MKLFLRGFMKPELQASPLHSGRCLYIQARKLYSQRVGETIPEF